MESTNGFSSANRREDRRIVEWNILNFGNGTTTAAGDAAAVIHATAATLMLRNPAHRPVRNRQVTQTQQVNFKQTQVLDSMHVCLGNDLFPASPLQSHIIRKRTICQHNPGRMLRHMPGESLNTTGNPHYFTGLRLLPQHGLQARRFL